MEQSTDTRHRPAQGQREELADRPGPRWQSVFSLIGFGLLLTVTLVIDALRDASTMSGLALIFAGIMLFAGVAELLDPAARRLVVSVRYGGMAMAVLGLVLQFVG